MANAEALAQQVNGSAHSLHELPYLLDSADLVVAAASAPEPLIDVAMMQTVSTKPRLLVDIAIPSNIAADVAECDGVELCNVDAIGNMVERNTLHRTKPQPVLMILSSTRWSTTLLNAMPLMPAAPSPHYASNSIASHNKNWQKVCTKSN